MTGAAVNRSEGFCLGDLYVYPSRNMITIGRDEVHLEPKVMDVLCLLAERSGDVVSRNDMIEQIWQVEFGADESLTRAISLLRKALQHGGGKRGLIETIPKRGYRLVADVAVLTPLPDQKNVQDVALPVVADMSADSGDPPGIPADQKPALPTQPDMMQGKPDSPAFRQGDIMSRFTRRNMLIGGAVATVSVGAIAAWASGLFTNPQRHNGIVVLPFENLSGDPEQSYFSDGLTSEIRTRLSRNPLMQIVGQTSSNNFRDNKTDAKTISKQLNVSYLLDGNVQRSVDRFKIATDLIDGRTGLSRWSESFERPITDIFAVQAEIATAIASALALAISDNSADAGKEEIGSTQDLAAFDAFLRGQDFFELHIDEASERAALAKFDEAIAADTDYAAARAARSRVLAVIANQYVTGKERIRLYDEAIAEARKAAEIAPEFAAGYSALGYSLFYGRLDVKGAREPYDRAYALAKSDVDVFSRFAVYCARTGRFGEAYRAIDRAAALDPLNASVFRSFGLIKYAEGQYQEAIDQARHALEINPDRSIVHSNIGDAYVALDDLGKAKESYDLETSDLFRLTGLAIVEHLGGNAAQAQVHFDRLVSDIGDNGVYQQAEVLAQWGDISGAFAALDRAREVKDSGLVYLLNDPFLNPLRSDKRFNDLLLQLGFI